MTLKLFINKNLISAVCISIQPHSVSRVENQLFTAVPAAGSWRFVS